MSSMADTYILASKARAKLTREASRPDHDLRILVSHANLLDNLMDKIHTHRQSILNADYSSTPSKVSFTLPDVTHVSVATEYDSDSDSDEDDISDEDDDSFYYRVTQISYHGEDDYDDDFESDEELTDDEELELEAPVKRSSAKKYREMPTIDELTEFELEDLHSASEDESDNEDEEEVDISELKRTPSLVYSTYEESESEDEDDTHELSHTHPELQHDSTHQKILEYRPVTHGDLLLENLDEESFTPAAEVLCS